MLNIKSQKLCLVNNVNLNQLKVNYNKEITKTNKIKYLIVLSLLFFITSLSFLF